MSGKIERRLFLPILLIVVILSLGGGFVWMVRQDLALQRPQAAISVDGEEEILVTVERIDVEREMDGRLWHLSAERLERSQAWAKGHQVDITLADEEGRRWTFSSPVADYRDDLGEIRLQSPEGSVDGEGYALTWAAGEANWIQGDQGWTLSRGLAIEDSLRGIRLEGQQGFFDINGVVVLREEAQLFWQRP
ncbi:MAG: hypothetical protein JMJ93_06945 [Synergistaceae bacterium]|nr:hypothetical protein [Synergistaceae bacterium]